MKSKEEMAAAVLERVRREVVADVDGLGRLLLHGLSRLEALEVADDRCVLRQVLTRDAEPLPVSLAHVRLHEVGVAVLVVRGLADDDVQVCLLGSVLGPAYED